MGIPHWLDFGDGLLVDIITVAEARMRWNDHTVRQEAGEKVGSCENSIPLGRLCSQGSWPPARLSHLGAGSRSIRLWKTPSDHSSF